MVSFRSALVLVLLLALAAAPLAAARDGWILLGERSVSDAAERDVVPVSGVRGEITALKLGVSRAGVQFRSVTVHYANGGSQELELREVIPAGGESRVIDLQGDERVVRSIDLVYDAQSRRGRHAVVRVWGRR